jgi:hypothetical protein
MTQRLFLSTLLLALALAPPLRSQQVGGAAPGPAAGEVPLIFLPSPTVPDADAASRPIPRLLDGARLSQLRRLEHTRSSVVPRFAA